MSFPKKWIDRVMSCVTTQFFSILINGKPYGNVLPSRGLRQGDPLLPYSFLLCAKGFTSLRRRQKMMQESIELPFVKGHLESLTYYLQMIHYCSARQHKMKWWPFMRSFNPMPMHWDSALIWRNHQSISAVIHMIVRSKKYRGFWGYRR